MCNGCACEKSAAKAFNEEQFWINVQNHLKTLPHIVVKNFLAGKPYFNGELVLPTVLPIRGVGN